VVTYLQIVQRYLSYFFFIHKDSYFRIEIKYFCDSTKCTFYLIKKNSLNLLGFELGPGELLPSLGVCRPSSVVCRLLSVVCKLFTFQASSPKPLGRLEPNLAGMFLGWSSTKLLFFVPVGYSIWLPGPIICSDWLKFQRSSSLKLMN
jgi:hypothetical protein